MLKIVKTNFKKIIHLSLLLLCIPIYTKQSSLEKFKSFFHEANNAYLSGQFEQSITYYKKALEVTDQSFSVYFNMAKAYLGLKNFDKAIECFNKGLEINPKHHKAHQALGIFYTQQKQYESAIKHFKKAVLLDNKDFLSHMNIGSNFLFLNQYQKAEQYLKKIQPLFPDKKEPVYNLAYMLRLQGKAQEAIPHYLRAIELDPDLEQTYLGLAKSYLATGNFSDGWHYFEWRFLNAKEHQEKNIYQYLQPKDLAGKIIFLKSEWGLGDMMHFIRYAKLVKDLGTTVYVRTHKPLVKLFQQCPFIDKVVPYGSKIPPFHIQIPMMSLPLIFKTTLETIPTDIPYLYADETLIKLWKEELAPDKNFKVGICWHSKPIFLEDNYLTKRSVPLKDFAILSEVDNISFYSLQKIYGIDQLENIPQSFKVHTFGPDFDNTHGRFMDTAALIRNLDLVITADTSIVHLAGALGKPVWILTPYVAEWRWLQNIDTTPWYPNARLFRQQKPIDWTHVMLEIKKELQTLKLKSKGE